MNIFYNFIIFIILGTGLKNGMTLYLDAHTQTGLYKSNKSKNKMFTLTLQHFDNFPLVSMGGVVMKTGQRTRYHLKYYFVIGKSKSLATCECFC